MRTIVAAVLLLSVYTLAGPPMPSTLTRNPDGGWANRAWCDGVNISVSGGSGGGGYAYVNAVIDGGSITVNNFPATQPVSGTLTCNAGSGTMAVSLASAPTTPVTGTFWQATQPVSIASMPSTPVTGTFWQATQPVSGTVTVTGVATAANQTTLNTQTTKINDGTDTVQVTSTSGGAMQVECVAGCGSPATPVSYTWATPNAVGGASKLHLDFFNANSRVVKILGIYPHIKTDVAVVGVVSIRFDIFRTSAVGTGGTAANYNSATVDVAGGSMVPADTTNSNPSTYSITGRHLPTGGATISAWVRPFYCFTEETNASTYFCDGAHNILETGNFTMQPLTLRFNEGILIKQNTVASLNNIGFTIIFSIE